MQGFSPLVIASIFVPYGPGEGGGQVEQLQPTLTCGLPSGTAGKAGTSGSRKLSSVSFDGSLECRGSPRIVGNTPLIRAEPPQPAIQA